MKPSLELFISLIASVLSGAALSAFVQHLFLRKKVGAEAGKILAESEVIIFDSLRELIAPLRSEIVRLADDNANLHSQNANCQATLIDLRSRIQTLEAENAVIKARLLRLRVPKPED